jgi:two-component SAPR family response regulator
MIVDDEERALNLLKILLKRFESFTDQDEIFSFTSSKEALHFLQEHTVDILFLDIEMPALNGIELGEWVMSKLSAPPEIIYVTAFPQYALKAWEVGAMGYILKPYNPTQIYNVLKKIFKYHPLPQLPASDIPPENSRKLPYMRCFPDFEMLLDGQPLHFKTKKSKELLALLVHHKGNWVNLDKVTFCLLENAEETSSKNYSRTILYRLKQTLAAVGYQDIVESKYGKIRINPETFTCDYYDYLDGNLALFQGDYMGEYPWAESTKAAMWNRMLHT